MGKTKSMFTHAQPIRFDEATSLFCDERPRHLTKDEVNVRKQVEEILKKAHGLRKQLSKLQEQHNHRAKHVHNVGDTTSRHQSRVSGKIQYGRFGVED